MIAALKEIVKQDYTIFYAGNRLEIDESARDAKCKKVIFDMSGFKACVIKYDDNCNDIHPLLKQSHFKCPEAIIFCEKKNDPNRLFIFIVEMKSNKIPQKFKQQMNSGKAIASYLTEKIRAIKSNGFGNVICKGIVFSTDPEKTTTSVKRIKFQEVQNCLIPVAYKRGNNTIPYMLDIFCY